jgi:hydrogenase-4 component F
MPVSPAVLARVLLLLPILAAVVVWLPRLWYTMRRADLPHAGAGWAFRVQDVVTTCTSLLSVVAVVALAARARGEQRFQVAFIDMYVDSLSILFLLLVSLVAVMASFYIGPYWRQRQHANMFNQTLFYSFFNLFHFTMVLVPMVSNLVILWIGIELTTVTSTALIAIERTRRHFEAAWKYIVITSAGIIFALLGTLFLANAIPPSKYPNPTMGWPNLVEIAGELDPDLVRLSFLFVLVGYGTKAGLAPMHTWLPDAHGEAPYPVSALLSGVLLKSALYVILRFLTITNESLGSATFTSAVLLSVGLLSLATATPLILKRNRFKRVLAYHSLEHMGIITIGIGIGGPIAAFGALLHVLNHGVTKSLMFLAYGNVQDRMLASGPAPPGPEPPGSSDPEADLEGVMRAMPVTGSMLALGGLALVGSPPFSIFLSELLILWGGVDRLLGESVVWLRIWLVIAIVLFVGSVTLIFGGLVRHLGRMLLGDPPVPHVPEAPRRVVPLLLLFAVVVLLGVFVPDAGPVNLRRLLDDSVTIVCGGGCG